MIKRQKPEIKAKDLKGTSQKIKLECIIICKNKYSGSLVSRKRNIKITMSHNYTSIRWENPDNNPVWLFA